MSQTLLKALQTYQQGDFQASLALTRQLVDAERLRTEDSYALLGNNHLKLGDRRAAADAFLLAAECGGKNAPMLSRIAFTLFDQAGFAPGLLAAGPSVVRHHPGERALVYRYAEALFAAGQPARVTEIAGLLDRNDRAHMALIINCLRLTNDFDSLARELEAGCRARPDDLLLATTRHVMARETCDFDEIRAVEAVLADPDSPAACRLMQAEPALARLLWGTSDAVNRRPSADSLRAAALPRSLARRPFGAAGEPIRIGYLSADFYAHATMWLLADVLAAHDRASFDITLFCHSGEAARPWQREHLPADLFASLVPVEQMSDAEAASAIAARGIDILVDLKGLTMQARPGIAKLCDAPVKATWLGFPGSATGVGFDYAIGDRFVTPDSAAADFEEHLCRLPESYQPNCARLRPLRPVPARAAYGLPEDRFVFASFNALQKITPDMAALWAKILAAVPGSVFWIFAERDRARRNLTQAFAAQGIDPARLIFADVLPYEQHLARLPLADLALDTFPYTGHTTTSDLLWAGVPLLTMSGGSFASRVSESLLSAIGLDALVTRSPDAFVAEAVALAGDPARLAALRAGLEDNRFRAPLFDAERFTRHLELAYHAMAARARAGKPPAPLDIPALPPRKLPFSARSRSAL